MVIRELSLVILLHKLLEDVLQVADVMLRCFVLNEVWVDTDQTLLECLKERIDFRKLLQ